MKHTLEDIWEQANSDKFAMRIDSSEYEAIIIFGCRITRDFDTKKVIFSESDVQLLLLNLIT